MKTLIVKLYLKTNPTKKYLRSSLVKYTMSRHKKQHKSKTGPLPGFWHSFIERIQCPTAIKLLPCLDHTHFFGVRKLSSRPPLFKFFSEQKMNYPCDVLLLENGKFFDTHGVDALMVVEHCGVNPMPNGLRAGIHSDNIQRSCDQLINAGINVVVFEQIETGKNANTTRVFLQRLSPLQPTYFGRHVKQNLISKHVRTCVPLVGIQEDSKDTYQLAFVDIQSHKCIVRRAMTKGSVLSFLQTIGAEKEYTWSSTSSFTHKHTLPTQTSFPELFLIDALSKHPFIGLTVPGVEIEYISHDKDRPRSLYPSTLLELGMLEKNGHVPCLVDFCLQKGASAACKKKLFNWLSNPPSVQNAAKIKIVIGLILSSSSAFPKCAYINPKKFLPLISRRKLSIAACHELKHLVDGTTEMAKLDLFPSLFLLAASENSIENLPRSYFEKTLFGIQAVFDNLLTDADAESGSELDKWNFRNLHSIHGLAFSNFSKELQQIREAFLKHKASFPSKTELSKNNLSLELGQHRIYIAAKKKGPRLVLTGAP